MPLSSNPIVSIIVPCFNYGHLVGETLDSLKKQTLEVWECIVVDDGSSDNTKEVVSKYTSTDKRYSYIYQKNAGLSAARNTGLKVAKGEFIQLLDADDFISDFKLECQVQILKTNPSISLVYGETRYFKTNNPNEVFYTLNEGKDSWMKGYPSHEEFIMHLIEQNLFAVNCALFRSSILFDCGEFNPKLKSVEDWEFWIRCALKNFYFYFDANSNTNALVRIHESSMSQNYMRMHDASLIARYGLRKYIAKSNLPYADKIRSINDVQIKYLHRILYSKYKSNNKLIQLKHLFTGYPLKKEWRFILNELVKLIRGSR
jgi:glycosyltransferase involved in cell wall biosynthesis